MCGTRPLAYADSRMKNFLLTLLHLAVTTAKLCGPGGVRAVIARESPAQAATDRPAPCSPAGAESRAERPADLRLGVALPQSRKNPKGRHRRAPVDAPGVSSGVGASQVPSTLLVQPVPEEARAEGAERRTHPGHRRAQVAQSSVRLSADCAHHLADVRSRHRQARRLPRAVETLSPRPWRHRALVVVVHRTHARQPVERGSLSMRVHRAPELLGARRHGPVHATPRRSRRAARYGQWGRPLSDVERGHSWPGHTATSQHRS